MRIITVLTLTFVCTCACTNAKTNTTVPTLESQTTTEQIIDNFIEKKISDSFYILKSKNYRTNIGVFIGESAIVLIDPMSGANTQQALLEKIRTLSKKPIQYVINTHGHLDHSGANDFFASLGASIIAQENAGYTSNNATLTFQNQYTLKVGQETIAFYHIIAHSMDDVLVHFTKNNVVFMGDAYMTHALPNFYFGGGSEGQLQLFEKALSLGNDQTQFIAGHGNMSSSRKTLLDYQANLSRWISRIKALHSQSKSVEQIAKDNQIQQWSAAFENKTSVNANQLQQTIGRVLSSDVAANRTVLSTTLKTYEGIYRYSDQSSDRILLHKNKLFVLSQGFMFALVPITNTQFHIRGHYPHRHITFKAEKNELLYFNGSENRIANKQ